jgi:hypothetical protein
VKTIFKYSNTFTKHRASVMAQKLVDERHGPIKQHQWWKNTRRNNDFNHFYIAGSSFKGKDEGCINSFKAHRYYSDEAGKRRDELLKEIAEEEKAASA